MTTELRADIAILMPQVSDDERFRVRYAGLSNELANLAVEHCFVESHISFIPDDHAFMAPYDKTKSQIADRVRPSVVRDLTMSLDDKPLYADEALTVVHAPATNRYIADKSNMFKALPEVHPATLLIDETGVEMALDMIPGNRIIVKPTTGMLSKGISVLNKASDVKLGPGTYMAQEYVRTDAGMPEHGIYGMHNLRIISIGSQAVGAIARLGGDNPDILANDFYGNFVSPDTFSSSVEGIVNGVHSRLQELPGNGNNVIAIDIMRGTGADGEVRDYLCEVNRRPLRISQWDLSDERNLDRTAIVEMAQRWDKAEAAMLASLVV